MRRKAFLIATVFVVLFIMCVVGVFLSSGMVHNGHMAYVYLDGECIREIDLSEVEASFSFTVESKRGYNTLFVENGRISVIDADCRDGICMQYGAISNELTPIVCLPNRLVISIGEG